MRITVPITTNKEINLDDNQAKEITLKFLQEQLDIPDDAYIDGKGNLVYQYLEYGGSHSWLETEIHRKSTESDKAFLLIKRILNKAC